MKWLDYREQLGIGFDDSQKANMFKSKLTALLTTLGNHLTKHDFTPYYVTVGETPPWYNYADFKYVVTSIVGDSDIRIILSKIVALINSAKNYSDDPDIENLICNCVLSYLKSTKIDYDLVKDKDGIFIFPKGAKELDDALVSQPLEWLKDYSKAYKTYCVALRQYSDGVYIRDVADNLRKTLEAFLQEFLKNDKNLESNKNEICKYLGLQGVDAGISGLFQPLINAYKNINDRIAKHNDKVDKKLLEFLLYQTGVLIRMILVVKQSETED